MWSMNTRGRQVSERLSLVEDDWPHLKGESPEIAAWCEQGQTIRTVLVAAMHGDLDPSTVDESPIREWQAEGRNIERFINRHIANLGKWATESGYSPAEAAEAIARGERPPPLD
jgi:hypothetical protein